MIPLSHLYNRSALDVRDDRFFIQSFWNYVMAQLVVAKRRTFCRIHTIAIVGACGEFTSVSAPIGPLSRGFCR
jgi:hypothetical protein